MFHIAHETKLKLRKKYRKLKNDRRVQGMVGRPKNSGAGLE